MNAPEPPSPAARRAIVVLGMHRSGTSLLASLLQTLGVDLGPDLLLEARPDNEAGYWEHAEIADIHEAILERLGRSWYRPEGLAPLPDGWWRMAEIRPFRRRLADIVERETAASVGPWGFKDPRTVRLLPLWKEVFAATGVQPTYLLAIRDPEAVAASLAKRDRMTPAASQLLWLEHTLDAFRHAGDEIAAVVDYDDWFVRPVELAHATMARLGLQWPADQETLEAALARIVRPDLRHANGRHGSGGDRARLLPEVRELHAILRAAAPDAPPVAAVAPLLARVDGARRLLAAWGELAADQPRQAAELAAAVADAEEARRAGEQALDEERLAAAGRLALEEARGDAFARDHAALQRLYGELDGRRVDAEAEVASLHERLSAAHAEMHLLRQEIDQRQRILDAVMPDPAHALEATWNSTSLRLVRPIQRLVGGHGATQYPAAATPEEQARFVVRLQTGFFWNLTGPIRAFGRLLRGGRQR